MAGGAPNLGCPPARGAEDLWVLGGKRGCAGHLQAEGRLARDRDVSFVEFGPDGTLGGRVLGSFLLPGRQWPQHPSGLLAKLQVPEGMLGAGDLGTHATPSCTQAGCGPLGYHPSSPTGSLPDRDALPECSGHVCLAARPLLGAEGQRVAELCR